MTLIGWLILAEGIIAVCLLLWYLRHAHHHVKKNPAEAALKEHLRELEAAKQSDKQGTDT